MNIVRRGGIVGIIVLAFACSVTGVFADSVVNVFVPQVKISTVTSAAASGICGTDGDAVSVTFRDGGGHTVSPVSAPICAGGHWSTNVDLTSLNDGVDRADVVEGPNSALNVAFNKDTIAPFLDGIFVYDGTFDTNFDPNFDGTQSALAAGYIFATTTPPFELSSSDSLNTVGCSIDSGFSNDCSSFFYRPPTPLANGTHTLHIALTDSAGNSAATSTDFCVNSCGTPDSTAPVIGVHADVYATSTTGLAVTVAYAVPTVTDNVDPSPVITCSPLSGTSFAVGNTTVTCNAHDASLNNATSTTFVVHVIDDEPVPTPAPSPTPAVGGNGPPVSNVQVPVLVQPTLPVIPAITATAVPDAHPIEPVQVSTEPTPPHVVVEKTTLVRAPVARELPKPLEQTVTPAVEPAQVAAVATTQHSSKWYLVVLSILTLLAVAGLFVWNTFWTRP